jgi:iron complex outermembrane receptor protein
LFSAFTQDEFALFRQRLRVTVGSKFEHNEFTGFEMEPNARFLWMMSGKQSVWGAISRAVRTPARSEEDVRLLGDVMPPSPATLGLPLQTAIWGSHAFDSENLIAYEGGYRVQLGARLSADIATFYNSYSDLQSAEPQNPFLALDPMPVHLVLPIFPANKRSGATHGMELFTEWKGAAKWKLSGSYSFLSINTHTNAGSLDSSNPDGSSPRHQYYVRSSFDPTKQLEQDVTLRYVHSLDGLAIPSYYSLDARIGWKAASNLDFSITGKNLTNNRHVEFSSDFIGTSPTQVKRTFHAGLMWRF